MCCDGVTIRAGSDARKRHKRRRSGKIRALGGSQSGALVVVGASADAVRSCVTCKKDLNRRPGKWYKREAPSWRMVV
jgi:hypothetical protein